MNDNKWDDFKSSILHLNDHRIHKITSSLGVYDAYKWIRKHKWLNIGRPITEHEFYSIIRKVNEQLSEGLLRGEDIILPHNMGKLELRKREAKINICNNKLETNLPINWDRTLKLWYEDKEAYNNKTLIRMEEKEIYKISYNKIKANYNNKSYYEFKVNKELKRKLKQKIREGRIDAFINYGKGI